MELMELDGGRASLEFGPDERLKVERLLRTAARTRLDPPRMLRKPGVTYERLVAGEQEFILTLEDGSPALISTTPAGSRMLRAVLALSRQRSFGPAVRHSKLKHASA